MLKQDVASALFNLRQRLDQRYLPPTPDQDKQDRRDILAALKNASIVVPFDVEAAVWDPSKPVRSLVENLITSHGQSATFGAPSRTFVNARLQQRPGRTDVTPFEALDVGQPARDLPTALAQVHRLISERVRQLTATTTQEALALIAKVLPRAGHELVMDSRVGASKPHYAEAFHRLLGVFGIDCTPGHFSQPRAALNADRADLTLRSSAEVEERFQAEKGKPLDRASSEELLRWFLERPFDAELLIQLSAPPTSSDAASDVRSAIALGLSTNAVTRYTKGADRASLLVQFGREQLPPGTADDSFAGRLFRVACQRVGMEGPGASSPREARPQSVGTLRLAHELRQHPELAAAFKASEKTDAREATPQQLVEWFRRADVRSDQVLELATRGLPNDEAGLAQEELRRCLLQQALPGEGSGKLSATEIALIVVANEAKRYVDERRQPQFGSSPHMADASRALLINLGFNEVTGEPISAGDPRLSDLAERIRANPTLAPRLAKVPASSAWSQAEVIRWFREQPIDCTAILEIAQLA